MAVCLPPVLQGLGNFVVMASRWLPTTARDKPIKLAYNRRNLGRWRGLSTVILPSKPSAP